MNNDVPEGPIARVIRKLAAYPGLKFGRLGNRLEIEAPGPEGFPLSFVEEAGRYSVFFGPCPLRFKDENEALDYLAFGLSPKCRLRELSRGKPYRWVVEQRNGEGWSVLSVHGSLLFPFWKPKTQKSYMNSVLA